MILNCVNFSIIFVIFSIFILTTFSLEITQGNEFWLTTDLLSVEWKKGCLTTAFCHEPKFQLINTMTSPIRENMQINWPVSEDIVHDQARSFVTHWTKGSPEEVSLTCQIVGTDPTFGFARVCDETQPVKIFKQTAQHQQAFLRARREDNTHSPNHPLDESRMIVEVRGKCFNATLAVQKHTQRCPWCPDPSLHIHLAGPPDAEARLANPGFFDQFHSQDQFVQMCVFIGLAVITVITSTACGCLLVMYIKQKKQRKNLHKGRHSASKHSLHYSNLKQNGLPNGQYHQIIEPLKGKVVLDRVHRDDTRYETPWESKYRPLPFLLSSSSTSSDQKSNSTTTSPLDSSSALGSVYDRTTPGRLIIDHGGHMDDNPNCHYVSACTMNRRLENV